VFIYLFIFLAFLVLRSNSFYGRFVERHTISRYKQVEAKFEAYKNDELVEKKTVRLYAEDRVVCGRDSKKKVGWQVLHTSVSRRHAKITVHKDGRSLEIEDLGSTYGTFVNGVKIQRPTRVASGSEIRFAASSRKWWLTKLIFPKKSDNMDEPALKEYIRVLEKSSDEDLPRQFDDFVELKSLMAHSELRHLPKYSVKHVVETIASDPLKRLETFENESKTFYVRSISVQHSNSLSHPTSHSKFNATGTNETQCGKRDV